ITTPDSTEFNLANKFDLRNGTLLVNNLGSATGVTFSGPLLITGTSEIDPTDGAVLTLAGPISSANIPVLGVLKVGGRGSVSLAGMLDTSVTVRVASPATVF